MLPTRRMCEDEEHLETLLNFTQFYALN